MIWGTVSIFLCHDAHLEAHLTATRLGIAAAVYRMRNSRNPEKLEDLVPEILAELPVDPFSGKGYVYRERPDGGFVVYSVGQNQTDDGGTVERTASGIIDRTRGDVVFANR